MDPSTRAATSPEPALLCKLMQDEEELQDVYAAYKARGATCRYDEFKTLLRAFYEHSVNSHVYGECEAEVRKDKCGLWIHPSPSHACSAWCAETGQAFPEFSRLFSAVDSVHAYT